MRRPRGTKCLGPAQRARTRKVEIAGIACSPNGLWMNQAGRNLTDAVDGLLNGKRYLIHDRDPLFTAEFLSTLAETGVAFPRG
jgi:putative transposase